ncbi:MAG: efflux RND transporter periplasmic adaptor subunit [Verrucomicrobiota bacterium]|nr:efflux RND transporter periplasmic adaptor subunit [Verrucomicrobiota bacterium]
MPRRLLVPAGVPGIAPAILALALLSGCGRQPPPHATLPPEVGVVTITTESLPITTDLPGRIDPVRTAQVRARVAGILLKRVFEEGSDVKEGEVLFRIDPAPFQAAYDSAKAALAKAAANNRQNQALARRYTKLVKIAAVSKQDYDNAVAAAAQGRADVLAAKAALETASLNLGYCTVTAPISGRIGPALVTEGALVGQNSATELAVIQQLDPIYFDFTESSTEVLKLRREFESGQLKSLAPGEAKVTLLLEDGTTYAHPGRLLFSDITVDPTTGMVTLRALFPNPDHLLMPGMFARARLEQAVDAKAITVSQRGVTYGPDGKPSVMVVTPDNKVEERPVTVGSAVDGKWIITGGLKVGDRVILAGLQKVRPGVTVKPVPFESPTNAAN